ncbi:MAG: hypothetical protein GY870_17795 [archaeon]|nr:hypothetical protein [archaeon]
MNSFQIMIIIIGSIQLVLQLIIGFVLYKRMKETELYNLKWLIFYNLITAFTGMLHGMNSTIFSLLFDILAYMALIFFINETFYTGYNKIFKRIIYFYLLFSSSSIGIYFFRHIFIDNQLLFILQNILFSFVVMIPAFWLISSILNSFKAIKNLSIDKWIKIRYKVLGISGIPMLIQSILINFVPYDIDKNELLSSIIIISMAFVLMLFTIIQYHVWVVISKKIGQKVIMENGNEDGNNEGNKDEMIKEIIKKKIDE